MNRLRNLEPAVKKVLEKNKLARKDDTVLICEVFRELLGSFPIQIKSFEELMLNHTQYNLPAFETVTRCRRKLQSEYPELSDKKITLARTNITKEHIEYALDMDLHR